MNKELLRFKKEIKKRLRDQESIVIDLAKEQNKKFEKIKKELLKELNTQINSYLKKAVKKGKIKYIEPAGKPKPTLPRKEILELKKNYLALSRKLSSKVSNKFKKLEEVYFSELEKIRKDVETLKLPKITPDDVKKDLISLKRRVLALQGEVQLKPASQIPKKSLKSIRDQINDMQNKLQVIDANIGRSISEKFLDFKKFYIKEIKRTISKYEELLETKPILPRKEILELKKNYFALSRKLNDKISNKFKELEETFFLELEKIRKDVENLKAVKPSTLEIKKEIIAREISNKISNKFKGFEQIYLSELKKVQMNSEKIAEEAHKDYLAAERIREEIQSKISKIALLRNEIEELKHELNKFKEESSINLLKKKFEKIAKEMDFLENEVKKVADKHLATLDLLETIAKKSKR